METVHHILKNNLMTVLLPEEKYRLLSVNT